MLQLANGRHPRAKSVAKQAAVVRRALGWVYPEFPSEPDVDLPVELVLELTPRLKPEVAVELPTAHVYMRWTIAVIKDARELEWIIERCLQLSGMGGNNRAYYYDLVRKVPSNFTENHRTEQVGTYTREERQTIINLADRIDFPYGVRTHWHCQVWTDMLLREMVRHRLKFDNPNLIQELEHGKDGATWLRQPFDGSTGLPIERDSWLLSK